MEPIVKHKKNQSFHIKGLDGFRGLAVLLVMLYHFLPNTFKGGYIGVPMFFLLSGYLMARLGQNRWEKGQFSIGNFYQSRIKRIYPSLFLFVGLCGLFIFVFLRRLLIGMIPEVLSIFGAYNNFWQIQQNASYFERISNASPFTHIWSLAIELQFYLMWPVLFISYQWLRQKSKYSNLIFLVLMIISMGLMTFGYRPDIDVTSIYYSTFTRIGAVFLGVWIGLRRPDFWYKILKQYTKNQLLIGSSIIILLLVLYTFFIDGQLAFTYLIGMNGMTLLLGIILIFISVNEFSFGNYFDNPLFKWLGTRSYELYLWHYAVIFFFHALKFKPSFLGLIIQLFLSAILAEANYQIVNQKLTSLSKVKTLLNFKDGRSLLTNSLLFLSYVGLCSIFIAGTSQAATKLDLEANLAENAALLEQQKTNRAQSTISTTTMSESELLEDTTMVETTIEETTQQTLKATERFTTFIGDSVLLGSIKEIQAVFPNSYIEAAESRQAYDVSWLVQQMAVEGTLGSTVVIALGTNGYFEKETGQELIDIIGSERDIFWVNVYGDFLQWEASTNTVINQLVADNDNVHLIDWEGPVSQNPEWLIADGIHPEFNGREEYARIVKETIESTLD